MTKSRVAECILSQVVPPDRAASTVGDWLEDAPKRGNVWFWSCVLRTAVSRVWSDLAESPGFMLDLALRSCLFSWLLYVVGTIVLVSAIYIFLPLHARGVFWFPSEFVGWTSATAYGVTTGRWTARRADGRKMAACIACCMAHLVLNGAISLASNQFLSSDLQRSLANHAARTPWIVEELIFETGIIVGFLWLRRPERSVAQ